MRHALISDIHVNLPAWLLADTPGPRVVRVHGTQRSATTQR